MYIVDFFLKRVHTERNAIAVWPFVGITPLNGHLWITFAQVCRTNRIDAMAKAHIQQFKADATIQYATEKYVTIFKCPQMS